jgi:hypothetical protein
MKIFMFIVCGALTIIYTYYAIKHLFWINKPRRDR